MTEYINRTPTYGHCHKTNYNQHGPWDTLVQTATCTELPGKFCTLYCIEISLPSTDGLTQFYEGVIALKSVDTPTWIFHHLLRPSTSVLRSLPTIIPVARDGMMGEITFSFMTNMEINRHEEQLTLEGEANGPHWRYYFDHSPSPCLSLDIYTHRHL